MRPIIEKRKFEIRYIVYTIIAVICIISVGIAVYMQFFRNENLSVIFGLKKNTTDEEYEALKDNFFNIFSNDVQVLENYTGKLNKIMENEDVVLLAYNVDEQTDRYSLNIKIPYYNVNENLAKKINQEIKSTFKDKSESILTTENENFIIYNVKYKAYIYNNIVSLVIMSELKEGNSSQRIIVQTYNYDLEKHEQVKIDEFIKNKNITLSDANSKIKEEVDASQEQNIRLAQAGYNVKVRNTESDFYKIQNAEQFFIGENGYLYVIYAYGNTEFTSEMNVIIFR